VGVGFVADTEIAWCISVSFGSDYRVSLVLLYCDKVPLLLFVENAPPRGELSLDPPEL
jgi:hypothetical protein